MPPASDTLVRRQAVDLDGAVYASPIVVGSRVYVATESDTVYALTTDGRQLWKTHLGEPSPASERPCGNIDPLGITGTPVYSNGVVYVAAEYRGPVRHELVAIEAGTGSVRWRKGIDLPGADPVVMQERGALTVAGGRVWVPFGGLDGDCGDYKGRVVGVRLDGSGTPIAYTVPTAREAGSWAPPGPSVDARGRLLVAVGNGASVEGDPYDFSDSILAIGTDAKLLDSFSPTTWARDNAVDADLGSQGPAVVGQWVFSAGKSGTAYVLRLDHLGGIGGQVSEADVCRSFGGTAVAGDVVYVPCTDGVRAVRIDGAGQLRVLWHAPDGITGSPVIGGGRIWALDTGAGELHALDPATGRSTASVSVGRVTRFATPALYGRLVFVPTVSGVTVVATS
jgi:outer membrane protein assembly factor BamB